MPVQIGDHLGVTGWGGRRPRSDTEGDAIMAADLLRRATVFRRRVKNFPLLFPGKSFAFRGHPVPNEGRIMIVILRGTGRGGRDSVVARVMRADERRWSVRRSRVVLTPGLLASSP
jgi:hypothetical protein